MSEAEVYEILERLGVADVGPLDITKAVWKNGKVVDVIPARWVMEFVDEIQSQPSPIQPKGESK